MQRIPALVFTLVAVQLASCQTDDVRPLVPPSERDGRAADALGAGVPVLAKLDGTFRFPGLDADVPDQAGLGAAVTYAALDSLDNIGLVQFMDEIEGERRGEGGGLPDSFGGRPLHRDTLLGGIRVASTSQDWMRAISAHFEAAAAERAQGPVAVDSLAGLPPLAHEVSTAPSWVLVSDMAFARRVAPRGIRDIPQIGTLMGRFSAVAVGLTPRADTLHVELMGEPTDGASATQIAGLLSAAALFAGMQSSLPERVRDIIGASRVTTQRGRVRVTTRIVNQRAR